MGDRVLRFPATLEAYQQALADLQAALDEHGVRARGRYNVELVFEEIVCNIIRHGRTGNAEPAVEVSLAFDPDSVVMNFTDNGRQFDPRHHPIPEKPESLDSMRVGGLGLLLVRKATTRIEYERTPQDKNHLTVAVAAGEG
jgi:serine/threonine-protein kinase RsbW